MGLVIENMHGMLVLLHLLADIGEPLFRSRVIGILLKILPCIFQFVHLFPTFIPPFFKLLLRLCIHFPLRIGDILISGSLSLCLLHSQSCIIKTFRCFFRFFG